MRNPNFKFTIVLLVGCIVCFTFWNVWIASQSDRKDPEPVVAPAPTEPSSANPQVFGKVIRRTRLDPNRQFSENILFSEGKEIGRFKNQGDEVYDVTGVIPDGEAQFIDESAQVYGVEHYLDGKRHGLYEERYSNGNIHKEIMYDYGKKQTIKEFFIDGQLRMEADYTDALTFSEDKDVGLGKVFFRNGKMMYEWNVTYKDQNRYKKSYNIAGKLIETKYFDQDGHLTKVIKPNPEEGSVQ